MERIVREEQILDVTVTGFVNQSRISEMYVDADVLVLPSLLEQWGLVVNEAMYFGLPLVLSDKAFQLASKRHRHLVNGRPEDP